MNVLYPPQIRNRPRRDSGGICWLVTGTGVGGWGRVGSSQPLSRLQAVTPASVSADSGVVVTRGWGLPWSFSPRSPVCSCGGNVGALPLPPGRVPLAFPGASCAGRPGKHLTQVPRSSLSPLLQNKDD